MNLHAQLTASVALLGDPEETVDVQIDDVIWIRGPRSKLAAYFDEQAKQKNLAAFAIQTNARRHEARPAPLVKLGQGEYERTWP